LKKLVALACAVGAIAAALLSPAVASAWAPAASATVHPGVMTFTQGAQCTSNFVFQDGSSVYIGQAAHCSGTGAATETNGCDAESLPVGTPVEVDGASRPGTMVYNSWITMQANGETNPEACAYNDFALVRLDPADVPNVNPSVPGFGGPTGVGSVGGLGSTVYSYGNSSLRGGVTKLSPKQGVIVANEGNVLEPQRVHPDAGDPGRLGQRVHERLRPGDRRPLDRGDPSARRIQQLRRHGEGARVHAREQLVLEREPRPGHGAVQPRLGPGDPGRVGEAKPQQGE